MASTPQFTGVPRCSISKIQTANSNRDGIGSTSEVMITGANGTRVDELQVKALGATTAGFVRIFINNAAGTYLLTELVVEAVTPDSATPTWEGGLQLNLVLPTGYRILASTEKGEQFNVFLFGGDF